jgi:gluconolactonase
MVCSILGYPRWTENNLRYRYPPTNEVFFVQNAGAPAAGTGLNKSSIIQKISIAEADAVKASRNATGNVTVTVVPSTPEVVNPNGIISTI